MGKVYCRFSPVQDIFYFYAVISLYPIVWMFFYSFKNNSEILSRTLWLPGRYSTGRTTSRRDHVQCPDAFHEQP